MLRCRSLYMCFVGAVFIFSFYNFAALTLVNQQNDRVPKNKTKSKSEEAKLEENMEIEMDGQNSHIFVQQEDRETLEEMELIQDIPPEPKIFWPSKVELALPPAGEGFDTCRDFRNKVNNQDIEHITPAKWDLCGRPNNAYAKLKDGTGFCIRHRSPHDFFVAGELLSFHMAEKLGVPTVPCTILHKVLPESKWKMNISELGWRAENDTVALIQWIPVTGKRIRIPQTLLERMKDGGSVTVSDLDKRSSDDLTILAQWSDIIIFDYLTAQYDRVASVQDEADKQNRTDLLEAYLRNIGVDSQGAIWLFDNEGGFLDGYILLYQESIRKHNLRFQKFQEDLLKTMCVFRRSTVRAVDHLYQSNDPLSQFLSETEGKEPLLRSLKFRENDRFKFLSENFNQRLLDLIGHFKFCSELKETTKTINKR